jgi:hypothetical protein
MPHDVFIGYSRLDSDDAKAVQKCLKDAGMSCFLDTAGIDDYAEWAETVATAIQECRVFLALVSKNSLANARYVNKELAFANQFNKPCVPVILTAPTYRGSSRRMPSSP